MKIFGHRTRMAVDLPCPTDDVSAAFLLSEVDRGVQAAFGGGGVGCTSVSGQPGPVHLNFMFPENLAPTGGAVRCVSARDGRFAFFRNSAGRGGCEVLGLDSGGWFWVSFEELVDVSIGSLLMWHHFLPEYTCRT